MEIYLFFKRFFVYAGRDLALWLHARGVTPNQASVASLFVILPMFWIIGRAFEPGIVMLATAAIALFIKLVLNAVDGIIARKRGDKGKLGMVLNVGTDIGPDLYILWGLLTAYAVPSATVYALIATVALYLAGEILFIALFGKQNLFYGKDLRTAFYFVLALVVTFGWDPFLLVWIYLAIALLHVVGFFLPSYRN